MQEWEYTQCYFNYAKYSYILNECEHKTHIIHIDSLKKRLEKKYQMFHFWLLGLS